MRDIRKAPESVINEDRKFNWGCYNGPIRNVNMLDADLGLKYFKNLALREWQAFQLHTDDGWFLMMAIYNTKKVCIVQFILYNIETKVKMRYEKKVLPKSMQIPNGLYNTICSHQSKGFFIEATHDIENSKLSIKVEVAASAKLPKLSANIEADHNISKSEPLVVCMPFSETKGMYSHKCLMPVSGSIQFGDQNITIQRSKSSLIIDDHKGYYPYPTKYDWATGLGFDNQGRRVGFNLTNNQVINQEDYNENCIWVDGEMIPLPPIQFERPNGFKSNWTIKDEKGYVDLVFTPVVHNSVKLNLGIIASKYEGPYGVFNGELKSNDGKVYQVDDLFGMGEEFYLRT
jgi:hypothetical protein